MLVIRDPADAANVADPHHKGNDITARQSAIGSQLVTPFCFRFP